MVHPSNKKIKIYQVFLKLLVNFKFINPLSVPSLICNTNVYYLVRKALLTIRIIFYVLSHLLVKTLQTYIKLGQIRDFLIYYGNTVSRYFYNLTHALGEHVYNN